MGIIRSIGFAAGLGLLVCSAPAVDVRRGPWGELELLPMMLSPMNEVLPDGTATVYATEWYFPGHTTSSLVAFLSGVSLSAAQQASLLDPEVWSRDAAGVIGVRPAETVVLSLSPESRARLYAELAGSPANQRYYQPWSIRTNVMNALLAGSELTPEIQAQIRRVAYLRGDRYLVSDFPVLLNATTDAGQKIRLLRLRNASSGYDVQLRVPSGGSVDALVAYWGVMGREGRIRPYLDAMSRTTGDMQMDITHLLPVFARTRLNTFPKMVVGDAMVRDCHWSSLNFFNTVPDDTFARLTGMQQEIRHNYVKIDGEPGFGDLMFFTGTDGHIIHSAVYLAANLVFTKNGHESTHPWVIMDVDNLQEFYAIAMHDTLTITYWRHRLR